MLAWEHAERARIPLRSSRLCR